MANIVQNHAFDLAVPVQNDALLISVDSNPVTICMHVPRQVPREDLLKLISEFWVTNYQKLYQTSVPIQSFEPIFSKQQDGTVEITFKRSGSSNIAPPRLFSAPVMML